MYTSELADNSEIFEYNDRVVNEKIQGILLWLNIIIPILFAGKYLEMFNVRYLDCIAVSVFVIVTSGIGNVLCKTNNMYKVSKWYGLIALQLEICFISGRFGIDIYMLYCIVPVISCFYFDRNFTLKIACVSYIIMICDFIISSHFWVKESGGFEWLVLTTSTYTFEYVLFIVVTTGISDAANNIIVILNKRKDKLSQMQKQLVMGFADLVESRDKNTGQHIKRTSEYVKIIIEQLRKNGKHNEELTDKKVKMIIEAAPLHDVGKIAVPDAILCKPARLTDLEYNIIKTHTLRGAEIIERDLNISDNHGYYTVARNMALYHHEKWDGTGYPCGIKGEQIPLCARIMAAADVLDALLSSRPYKKSFSIDEALEIMEKGRGSHFEPCIVDAVFQLRDKIIEMNKEDNDVSA